MPVWKHIRAIVLLPVTVTIVVPALILNRTSDFLRGGGLPPPDALPFPLLGIVYIIVGLILFVKTVSRFAREGHGTLAPWDPTGKLVISGVYRYVRNPMISGVLFILLGEATFLGSKPLLVWFLIFLVVNVTYIPLFEEKNLEKRFGEPYRVYKENVPRWIPRVKPWDPDRADRG